MEDITRENDELILVFIRTLKIEIPSNPDFEEKIKKHIGKKIGLFLVDNSYFFRVIEDNENAEEKNCSGDYRIRRISKTK